MRAAAALCLVLHAAPPAAAQPTPALKLEIIGDSAPALSGSAPSCEPRDGFPDAPARAIRLADGTVQLYASDQINRVSRGPDLLHLQFDCTVVLRGAGSDDPAAYDDHAWIASPWTDGETIWAIVHDEFHGHTRKALCPTGRYMDCWYNALTLAVSTDRGHSFRRAPGQALVATLPYRYDEVGLGHHGYFNPSNIVTLDGEHYMFAFATTAQAQRSGNCLMRTQALGQAETWLAWDGSGFTIQFANPYAAPVPPDQHVCAPVDTSALRWPVTSLVRHAATGIFIAIMQETSRSGGVHYATSPDLLHWSKPDRLLTIGGLSGWTCGDASPIAYPSLVDPVSTDRNFETIGPDAKLFATKFIGLACRIASGRTLISWDIRISITKH